MFESAKNELERSLKFDSIDSSNQFDIEFETVKKLNARLCPFKREDEYVDNKIYENRDRVFPIIFPKSATYDFSSEEITQARSKLLNTDNFDDYSIFDSCSRSCYIKDTILNDKKSFFADTTTEKKISSGAYGSVALYKDKDTDLPIASGKFVVGYDFKYNKDFFKIRSNIDTIHECLCGLELVNECKYLLPNYPETYGLGYCDINKENGEPKSCRNINKNNISQDAPVVFIQYLRDSFPLGKFLRTDKETFNKIYGKVLSFAERQNILIENIRGIYLQIFNALNILKMMNGCYTHYDLHDSNILLRKLDDYVYVPIYIFEGKVLKQINYLKTNYIAHIIDFGFNTFLSYETLLDEVNKNSTKYYGKTVDQIRKEFIFGNIEFWGRDDSKIEDQEFDIFKILGFSSFSYNESTHDTEFSQKETILEFFGHMYKLLYKNYSKGIKVLNSANKFTYVNTKDTAINVMRNYLKYSLTNRESYFQKPMGDNYGISYNDFVLFLSNINQLGNYNVEIYTENEILNDQNKMQIPTAVCLGGSCAQEEINNQFKRVYQGENIKLTQFYPSLLNEIRDFFIRRDDAIKRMLIFLSKNGPKKFTANTKNYDYNKFDLKNLEVIVTLDIILKNNIYSKKLTLNAVTTGKKIIDKLYEDNQINELMKNRKFNIFISDDSKNYRYGVRVYDNDNPVRIYQNFYIILEETFDYKTNNYTEVPIEKNSVMQNIYGFFGY